MLVRASPESSSGQKDADKKQAPSSSQNNQNHGDNRKTDNHKGTWNPPFKSMEPHEPLPVEDRKTNIDF
jgi:hypothetical protein